MNMELGFQKLKFPTPKFVGLAIIERLQLYFELNIMKFLKILTLKYLKDNYIRKQKSIIKTERLPAVLKFIPLFGNHIIPKISVIQRPK